MYAQSSINEPVYFIRVSAGQYRRKNMTTAMVDGWTHLCLSHHYMHIVHCLDTAMHLQSYEFCKSYVVHCPIVAWKKWNYLRITRPFRTNCENKLLFCVSKEKKCTHWMTLHFMFVYSWFQFDDAHAGAVFVIYIFNQFRMNSELLLRICIGNRYQYIQNEKNPLRLNLKQESK